MKQPFDCARIRIPDLMLESFTKYRSYEWHLVGDVRKLYRFYIIWLTKDDFLLFKTGNNAKKFEGT